MGKNKNKSKRKSKEGSPSPSLTKELSEADAAAGMMMVVKPEKSDEGPTKKETGDKKKVKKNNDDNNDGDDEDAPEKHNSKRARDNITTTSHDDDSNNANQKLTRKQKRQKLNEKNKWPQHPKIGNPDQRVKAYLRAAGIEAMEDEDAAEFALTNNKDKQQQKKLKDDDGEEWRRFGRFLGGTDARTRHRAVKKLGLYLKLKSGFGLSQEDEEAWKGVTGLSELDWMKLWKGLWYTLYMADKVPVQDELAKHLAKLIWCVAGTLEEDEVVGQHYMLLDQEEQEEEERELAEGSDGEEDSDEEQVKILSSRFVEMEDDESGDSGSDNEEKNSDSSDDDDDDGDEGSGDEEEDTEHGHVHDKDCNHGDEEEDEDPMNVTHSRGAPLASLMIRTFFRTLVKEWGKMDKYRIDKFYTLVRYMLREVYRYMATRQWNLGIVKLFNDALTEEALITPPNGVRYHLIDIAVEELANVVAKSRGETLPMTEAIYLEVMEPFFVMAQHGFGDRTVQARIVEKIFEKFLFEYSVVHDTEEDDDGDEDEEENDDKERNIFDQVHVGTVSRYIFELAGTEGTMDQHRKGLYAMHKKYERQIRKMGTDIDMESALGLGEGDEDDEDDEDYSESMEFGGDEDDDEEADDFIHAMGFLGESDEEENDEDAEDSEDDKPTKKSKKKDKKKKDALDEGEEPIKKGEGKKKDSMDVTQHGDEDGKKKNKKKKKKKKHDKSTHESDEEDVVTISLKDQKEAKKAIKEQGNPRSDEATADLKPLSGKKSKKKRRKSEGDGGGEKEDTGSRRVSFGEKNRARSWKASMKGLRDLNPKETISKTPEKGILQKKPKHSPAIKSGTPKQRKRAVDYF